MEDTEMKKEDETIDKDEGKNIDFPQNKFFMNFFIIFFFSGHLKSYS